MLTVEVPSKHAYRGTGHYIKDTFANMPNYHSTHCCFVVLVERAQIKETLKKGLVHSVLPPINHRQNEQENNIFNANTEK